MKIVTVEVTETYKYQITVKASTYIEALNKVKAGYNNSYPEYDGVFLADANSYEKTTFKVMK